MDDYGVAELEQLCAHFVHFVKKKYSAISMAAITTQILTDWATLKALVLLDYDEQKKGGLHKLHVHKLWQRVVNTYTDLMPKLVYLLKILLNIPYDNNVMANNGFH